MTRKELWVRMFTYCVDEIGLKTTDSKNISNKVLELVDELFQDNEATKNVEHNKSDSSLKRLNPFELGQSNNPHAIPLLINFLRKGTDNEKRLSASAISKLQSKFPDACQNALEPLICNLESSAPQVRQYSLKALTKLNLNNLTEDQLLSITEIFKGDEKEYNRVIAADILREWL